MLKLAAALDADQNEIQETTNGSPLRLISAVDLREMFGVTDMTIFRWLKSEDLGFPQPIRIATRRYWYEAEVHKWIEDRPRENV